MKSDFDQTFSFHSHLYQIVCKNYYWIIINNKDSLRLRNEIRFGVLSKIKVKRKICLLQPVFSYETSRAEVDSDHLGEGEITMNRFLFERWPAPSLHSASRVDFACSQIHGTIIDGDRPLEGSSAALSEVQRAGCSTRGTSHVRFAKAASLFINEPRESRGQRGN